MVITMKLTNLALIALALLLVVPAVGLFNAPVTEKAVFGTRSYTHTVFTEDCTATWCVHCTSAGDRLDEIYSSGTRDFYYVSLIDDMNQEASDRIAEFNIGGFPTVEFDGGDEEVVGNQSTTTNFETALDSCGARDVPDLSIALLVEDGGAGVLNVNVAVTNNDASDYTGTLKVYVTEEVSRYIDYGGHNYAFGLIGFAIDESITVTAGGTVDKTATWDGSTKTDLLGNDYGDIDPDNILVMATVFNSELHRTIRIGTNPVLNAYYADACVAAEPTEGGSGPQVSITAPSKYSTQSGTVDVKAKVTSSTDISSVKLKIDSGSYLTMTKSGENYVYSWDTTTMSDGSHTLTVQVTDAFSATDQASITVKVDNGAPSTGVMIENAKYTPSAPTNIDEITITCHATSDSGTITSVTISVCEGDVCQLPTEMSGIGDNTYEYKIGPYSTGTDVSYSITAKDDKGNTKSVDKVHIIIADSGVTDDDTVDDDTDDDTEEKENSFLPGFGAIGLIFVVAMIAGALYLLRRKS